MANLGNLNVFLNLNMVGFVTKLQTAKGQLGSLSAAVKQNSAMFKQLGRNVVLAGAVISAGVAVAVKAAKDFEYQMSFVNSMLTQTTEHYLPTFSKQLRKMAVEYGQTTQTLTKGTYDILSAQVEAGKAMEFMATASRAAVGGFTTVDVAVSALLTIMKTFVTQIKSVGEASDWLHAVVERGRITFEELATSIGTTAAMAAQAGMTVEDYGTAIAILTKGGLNAEKSQTALRGILRSVLKVQEGAIDTAKEMGLEWNVNALRADNFMNTLQKLNGTQIEYLAMLAPNIRGLLGWAVALSDVDEAARDHEAILNRAGLTQEKFEKASKSLTFIMNKFKAVLYDARIVIGNSLLPLMKELTETLISLTSKIRLFSEAHPVLFNNIVKLVGAFGLLLVPLGILISLLPGLVIAFKGIALTIVFLTGKMLSLYSILTMTSATFAGILGIVTALTAAVGGYALALIDLKKAQQDANEAQREMVDSLERSLTVALVENTKLLKERADTLSEAQKQEIEKNTRAIQVTLDWIRKMKEAGDVTEFQAKKIYDYSMKLLNLNTELRKAINNQEELNEVSISSMRAQVRRTEEYIDWERKLTLAKLSGLEQSIEKIRQEKAEALSALREKYDVTSLRYQEMSGIINNYYDQLIQNERDAAQKTKYTFNWMEEFSSQAAQNMQNAFSNFFFKAFTNELTSVKDAFLEFGEAVLQVISNVIAQWIAMKTVTGIASIFSAGSTIIGGVGGVSTGTQMTPYGSAPTWSPYTSGSYASGTDFVPQTGLYKLHRGEKVTPASENQGGITIQPVVVIQSWDSRDVLRNIDTISNGLSVALRNNASFREAIKKYSK